MNDFLPNNTIDLDISAAWDFQRGSRGYYEALRRLKIDLREYEVIC
jgi:hypothetical protein